ncbi:MAG TPA: NADH-quinone oxidoreductase subunit N [Stellaceae bacterium]|nr:NADH-quinone oxidoreductase subunit N [Stellaceae bacterium]
MNGTDLIAILPFLVLAAAVVIVMLAIAVRRRHDLTFGLALAGAVLSLAALGPAAGVAPRHVTPLFIIDGYALFYIGLILAATIAVLALSHGYLDARRGPQEEYYLLILLAAMGAAALVASDHFASFFLGLETLSISLLGLIAYPRDRARPVEAGIKYLILAGVSSAFLLFGMALIYARLGTLSFGRIAVLLQTINEMPPDIYWLTGLAMIVAGIGFKLSVVPFHMWAPDVYEGAPAPVTAFIAVVSKGAVFALLLRYYLAASAYSFQSALVMIDVVAIASILIGNLLALRQNNVKRILAYSSIAHLGYLLVAFLAGGALAVEAVTYYLVAYFVMTLGAFGIVTVLSASGADADTDALDDYRGLLWRRPWLAGVFTMMLLSLAGIPLTVGFMAKFYAVTAGIGADAWPAVFALVVGSVIGLFYYLRIIVVMAAPAAKVIGVNAEGVPWAAGTTLAVLTLVLVWLGVYPAPLVSFIRLTALHMAGG